MCERKCGPAARIICIETGYCPLATDIDYALPSGIFSGKNKVRVPRSPKIETTASKFDGFGRGKASKTFIKSHPFLDTGETNNGTSQADSTKSKTKE